jgi:hypothetical protein
MTMDSYGALAIVFEFNRYMMENMREFMIRAVFLFETAFTALKRYPRKKISSPTVAKRMIRIWFIMRKPFHVPVTTSILLEARMTVLALNEVKNHPEDYYANIAVSQVVNTKENFKLAFDFILESAKKQGNEEDVTAIEELRTKPLEEFTDLQALGGYLAKYQKASEETQAPLTVFFAREYTGMDFVRYLKGMQFSIENMYQELLEIDMSREVQEIDVPIYVFSGKHDIQANPILAKEYFNHLKAPKKEFFTFDHSGHSPDLEENNKFTDLVINTIKKETYRSE